MKRILVFVVFAVALVIASAFTVTKTFSYAATKSSQAVCYKVYLSAMSELVDLPEDATVVNLGFCYEVSSASPIDTHGTRKTLGHTTTIKCKRSSVNRILAENGVCTQLSYAVGDCLVIEGTIKNSVVSTQKVQVAYRNGMLSIGTPVIFGSY